MRGGRDFGSQIIPGVTSPEYFNSLIGGGGHPQAAARHGGPNFFERRREHISFLSGVRIIRDGRHPDKFSGYQVMRLATELMPSFSSILGTL